MTRDSDTVAAPETNEEVSFQRYRLQALPAGRAETFERRLIYIGTAPDSDLVLDNPTASRAHARLEFDGRGFLLRDLGSKNGTWVDAVRVCEAYVAPGSTLRFGTQEVRFEVEAGEVQVELSRATSFGQLIGKSSQMREIFALLGKVAPSEITVLIEGESGTGKELAAEAIHLHSARARRELVVFDCSAVAPELIESELFGHVKGAFTGAVADRAGVFAQADGSTLFLDEVGELPPELQPKLLRALERGEFKPVGSNARKRSKARVVAATNRNLSRAVEDGSFRQDLYYRLAVIKVKIPPLRQRPEDIPLLVKHFLEASNATGVQVAFETMRHLQAHRWKGNVRELRNYVERAVILAEHGRLETRHLSADGLPAREDAQWAGNPEALGVDLTLPFKDAKARLIDVFERRYWTRLLEQTGGNISEAARRGGIHRKSLEYLIRKLELK